MADDISATGNYKRKYDDQTPTARRPTGFSSPPAPSYSSVPPPMDEIQIAKQKAQEIAARLLSGANPAAAAVIPDVKRSRVDNGTTAFDSGGFASAPRDARLGSTPSSIPGSYGSYAGATSKKIEIPNGRVGAIIGKGGETIKYLQNQSGAKIQVTRDMDADLTSATRQVELMGSPEQIVRAEELINDVLAEAEAGASGTIARRFSGQGGQDGSEHFAMKIANNKVGLVIGKGGETIKNMQARTGARIQVIPLHLPPGDTSTERTVHIEGTSEQVEAAKQLVNEVTSENRARNSTMGGGYQQQGYQTRSQTSWGPPGGPPVQQPGYGYMQPGAYPSQTSQYDMSQQQYGGYPQAASGGYAASWDQSANQQTSQGYGYYTQQPPSQQQQTSGSYPPADNTGHNYVQTPAPGYNQQGQGYPQDAYGYGGYSQSGYGQPLPYDQQQNNSASSYGTAVNPSQEGHGPSYGAQGDSTQGSSVPGQQQQGYGTGKQASQYPSSYSSAGSTQPGYVMPQTSQGGYGNQAAAQPGYGSTYGPPPAQKPGTTPPSYGQTQQSAPVPGGYGQAASFQSGYPYSKESSSSYGQGDSGLQRTPPPNYAGATAQPGYGPPPPYGAPQGGQPGYAGGYPQSVAEPSDGNASTNSRGSYEAAPGSVSAQQSGDAKASQKS